MRNTAARKLFQITFTAAVGLVSACTFDPSGLEQRPPCETDGDCSGGVCLGGSCWYGETDGGDVSDVSDTTSDVPADIVPDAAECPLAAPECRDQIAAFCDESGQVVQVNCTDPDACDGSACACSNGACVPRACDPGRRICEGTDVLVCEPGGLAYSLVETCTAEQLCIGGTCVEAACEPGESRCFGESLAVCSPAGQFVEQTDCADQNAFCDASLEIPLCVPRVCGPGQLRCAAEGEAVEACDDRGSSWLAPVDCRADTYCEDGVCETQVCEPDSVYCSGPFELATCDGRGADFEAGVCAGGTRCEDDGTLASCVAQICEPNSTICTDDRLGTRICDPFGSGYLVDSPCLRSQFCADGACTAQVCTPAANRCTGNFTLATCDNVGSGEDSTTCAAGSYCNPGTGIASCTAQVCAPGAVRCRDSSRLEQCDERGSAWVTSPACPAGDVCFDDACRDVICTATSCASTAAELRCTNAGTGTETVPCAAGNFCGTGSCRPWVCTPSTNFCAGNEARSCNATGSASTLLAACEFGCEAGVCGAPECGDTIVSAPAGETCDDGNANACDGCVDCDTFWGLSIGATTSTSAVVTAFTPGSGDITFEAWVRAGNTTGVLVGLRTNAETDGAWLGLEDGRPYFSTDLGSAGGATFLRALSPTSINDGNWHHLLGVRRVNNVAVFVDGRLAAANTGSFAFTSIDANRLYVGRDGAAGSAGATALIDEVRVSSRVVSYENFSPVRRLANNDPNTILVYHFDDESAGTAVDSSAPARNMTLTGATLAPDSCFGTSLATSTCSDNVVAPWEQCDDGNLANLDGCSSNCQSEPSCAGGAVGLSGQCYFLVAASSWTGARDACVSGGGQLATINDWLEARYVTNRFTISPSLITWIGLNDRDTEGSYVWTSGQAAAYRQWNTGEPNNLGGGGGEDCVSIAFASGAWNDSACNQSYRGLCER